MIIEYVVPSLALKIIPVKNTKSFMKVLTVICGGVFELGNPKGRAGSSSFGNSGGSWGGGQKTVPSVGGEVWICSGRTNLYEMCTHK